LSVVPIRPSTDSDEAVLEAPPRGTLIVVGVFGAAVALGWVLLYFGLFLPRVTP
jgi:hypothetical protein